MQIKLAYGVKNRNPFIWMLKRVLSDLLTKPCEPWTGVNLIKGPVITRPWIVSLDPGQFWFPSGTYTNWFTGKVNTLHRFQKNHVTTLKLSFDYHFETKSKSHWGWQRSHEGHLINGFPILPSFHPIPETIPETIPSKPRDDDHLVGEPHRRKHTGLGQLELCLLQLIATFFRLLGVEFLRDSPDSWGDSPEFLRDSPEDMSLYTICVYSTLVRFSKSRTTAVETTKSGPTSCASTPWPKPRGPPRTR